mmetsp:Transcript_45660/g.73632  ORF Transcript_45660/g.73632 Transcript_45660/m.73632 type:complete len:247 (+) Transcript_45660:978-1718(+)
MPARSPTMPATTPVVKTARQTRKDPRCLPSPSPPTRGGTRRNGIPMPSKTAATHMVLATPCLSFGSQKVVSLAGTAMSIAIVTATNICPHIMYSSGEPLCAQAETQLPSASEIAAHASTSHRALPCTKLLTANAATDESTIGITLSKTTWKELNPTAERRGSKSGTSEHADAAVVAARVHAVERITSWLSSVCSSGASRRAIAAAVRLVRSPTMDGCSASCRPPPSSSVSRSSADRCPSSSRSTAP